jgi:hypothetical protein
MRNISASIQLLLAQDYIDTFYLVALGATRRHTTINRNITFNGDLFLGNSELASVEPPRLSSVVDREPYKVSYVDPLFTFRSEFETGMVGQVVIIYLGFINTLDTAIGAVQSGQPI